MCASFIILQFSSLYFFLLRRCSFSERNLHSFSPHFRVLIVDLLFCIVRLSLFGRFIAEKNVKFHLYEERVNAALCHSVSFFFLYFFRLNFFVFSPPFLVCVDIFSVRECHTENAARKKCFKNKKIYGTVCALQADTAQYVILSKITFHHVHLVPNVSCSALCYVFRFACFLLIYLFLRAFEFCYTLSLASQQLLCVEFTSTCKLTKI